MLADFGVTLPAETEIRVWDSTAEVRYLVVPMRPTGTDGWDEERLAAHRHPRRDDRHRRAVNGAHDMGGAHGFGPVVAEVDEPPFHADWERRVFALMIALGAAGRLEHRHVALGARGPAAAGVPGLSYYQLWLAGLERLLAEHEPTARAGRRTTSPADARPAAAPRNGRRHATPRFAVGDRVRTAQPPPAHAHPAPPLRPRQGRHGRARARLPRLPRQPRASAPEDPQWLYTVRFSAHELWGQTTTRPRSRIDAFEPYLERA